MKYEGEVKLTFPPLQKKTTLKNPSLISLIKVYEQVGAEKAKALIGFHRFSGCNTVEKFTGKSKGTWTKSFLNSDLDVFKALQLLPKHVNTKIMHNLEVFTPKMYSKKHLKVTNLLNYVGIFR